MRPVFVLCCSALTIACLASNRRCPFHPSNSVDAPSTDISIPEAIQAPSSPSRQPNTSAPVPSAPVPSASTSSAPALPNQPPTPAHQSFTALPSAPSSGNHYCLSSSSSHPSPPNQPSNCSFSNVGGAQPDSRLSNPAIASATLEASNDPPVARKRKRSSNAQCTRCGSRNHIGTSLSFNTAAHSRPLEPASNRNCPNFDASTARKQRHCSRCGSTEHIGAFFPFSLSRPSAETEVQRHILHVPDSRPLIRTHSLNHLHYLSNTTFRLIIYHIQILKCKIVLHFGFLLLAGTAH